MYVQLAVTASEDPGVVRATRDHWVAVDGRADAHQQLDSLLDFFEDHPAGICRAES